MSCPTPLIIASATIASLLSIAGCADHDTRARRLLAEAEAECGIEKGQLKFDGTSDDPKYNDRRLGAPAEHVIFVVVSPLSERTTDCVNRVLGQAGYRVGVLVTSSEGKAHAF